MQKKDWCLQKLMYRGWNAKARSRALGLFGQSGYVLCGHNKRCRQDLSANICGTYSKWAAEKLYTTKTPITGADLFNDKVLPFFASQEMGIIRNLTDRGTEYCGKVETHDYELFLGVNNIEYSKTKVRHPQTSTDWRDMRTFP